MNKQKFVDLIRQPNSISESSFTELEQLVDDNPYFHSAHTVIARTSRILKNGQSGKKINTAAIYATSRKALKNYIQGNIEFGASSVPPPAKKTAIASPPATEKVEKAQPVSSSPKDKLSQSDHDNLISEVYENIAGWKKSMNEFLDYELDHADNDTASVETPISEVPESPEASTVEDPVVEEQHISKVDLIKSQIEEEVIAEDEEMEEALKSLNKPEIEPKPQISKEEETTEEAAIEKTPAIEKKIIVEDTTFIEDEIETEGEHISEEQSSEEVNETLDKLNKQKKDLKLTLGNKGGKKFRLNILNRPKTKATKAEKPTTAKSETAKKVPAAKKPATKSAPAKKSPTKAKKTGVKKAPTKTSTVSKTTATKKTTSTKSSAEKKPAAKKKSAAKTTPPKKKS